MICRWTTYELQRGSIRLLISGMKQYALERRSYCEATYMDVRGAPIGKVEYVDQLIEIRQAAAR